MRPLLLSVLFGLGASQIAARWLILAKALDLSFTYPPLKRDGNDLYFMMTHFRRF